MSVYGCATDSSVGTLEIIFFFKRKLLSFHFKTILKMWNNQRKTGSTNQHNAQKHEKSIFVSYEQEKTRKYILLYGKIPRECVGWSRETQENKTVGIKIYVIIKIYKYTNRERYRNIYRNVPHNIFFSFILFIYSFDSPLLSSHFIFPVYPLFGHIHFMYLLFYTKYRKIKSVCNIQLNYDIRALTELKRNKS